MMVWNSIFKRRRRKTPLSLSLSIAISLSSGKHIFRIDILYFCVIKVENHKFCRYTAIISIFKRRRKPPWLLFYLQLLKKTKNIVTILF